MLKPSLRLAAAVGVVAFVVGALAFVSGWHPTMAERQSVIGYVNVVMLTEEYLRPALDEPLAEETARLQAQFDAEAEDLEEPEKEELFEEYQARLDGIKQQMIDEQLPVINAAIAAVAEELGVDTVIEQQVVLYGGADLTPAVLQHLMEADSLFEESLEDDGQ